MPNPLFDSSHFLSQLCQLSLPFLDTWTQFSLRSKVFTILSKIVVHVALGSFSWVERDRQVGKRVIEVIHHCDIGLALADGSEVRFDEFTIPVVSFIRLCFCKIFVPGLKPAAEFLDGFS